MPKPDTGDLPVLTGTVARRDVPPARDTLDAHVADFSNPRPTTAKRAIDQAESRLIQAQRFLRQ